MSDSSPSRFLPAFDLNGKVVLVTGAARRIGRSIALRLHTRRRARPDSLLDLASRGRPDRCRVRRRPLYRANLESVAEIKAMFADIASREGRLDALVNNAARFTRHRSAGDHRSRLGLDPRRQPQGRLLLLPAGRVADAPQPRRRGPHRQHQFDGRFPGLARARALLRFEGRRRCLHAHARQGAGAGDHGQLRRAGRDPLRRSGRAAHSGHGALHACRPARHRGRHRRRGPVLPDALRISSPARSCRSTAASDCAEALRYPPRTRLLSRDF